MKADKKICNFYFKMHYKVQTEQPKKEVEEKAITRKEEIGNIAVQENAKYKHLKTVFLQNIGCTKLSWAFIACFVTSVTAIPTTVVK
jgi:hypothetical protein